MAAPRRFFIATPPEQSDRVCLDREESHHLTRVLRLAVGEAVELLDGRGGRYHGHVEELGALASIRLVRRDPPVSPARPLLWVCQGDLKGKKMDEIVERCTELGVDRLIPFESSRSQGRVSPDRKGRRHERWQSLVRAACKQGGRLHLMAVEPEIDISRLTTVTAAGGSGARRLLFYEGEADVRLSDLSWPADREQITLMLGPEGGFSVAEVEAARGSGWRIVSLGSAVLRAETATLAAVAVVRHLSGRI